MITLIIGLLAYIGLHVGLYKIFQQHQYEGWKAFVPIYSELIWCKIIGRPASSVFWLWVPVVGFFVGVGMIVDLLRSYGRYSFGQHLLAGAFPFIYIPYMAFSKDLKYREQGYKTYHEWREQMRKATKAEDENTVVKLQMQAPHFIKGIAREWTEAILFAVFAAHFIRLFFFEIYTIPTSSMEGSLLVGDYLLVSKAHYGIRTPITPLSFPLLHNMYPVTGAESYSKMVQWPYYRLPGLQKVERFDPVVFNYPEGDSVFGRNLPYDDEYMNLFVTGNLARIQQIQRKYPVQVRPVDKRDHYIKRCVGISGDTVEVRAGLLYVNGQMAPQFEGVQYLYQIHKKINLDVKGLEKQYTIEFPSTGKQKLDNYAYASPAVMDKIKAIPGVDSVVRMLEPAGERGNSKIFPYNASRYAWNIDNYGPIYIPKQGTTVQLSMDNIALYQRIISVYEANKLEFKDGLIYINGAVASSYTFKMNYYWMMGDNRNQSADSRSWGFVPEDHIVGKPLIVLTSFRGASVLNGVRWERSFMSAQGF